MTGGSSSTPRSVASGLKSKVRKSSPASSGARRGKSLPGAPERPTLKERGLVRVTADVPVDDANLLARIAQLTGYNKVTTIVRAIRVLASLEEAERKGGEVTITYPDKSRERLLVR